MIRYPETAHAPARASKLPPIARPCMASDNDGQTKPLFQTHASDAPITVPPKRASARPTIAALDKCSPRKKGEANATHRGPVLTNTTELATLVYSSELIQVAK